MVEKNDVRCYTPNCGSGNDCNHCNVFYNFPEHNPNLVFLFNELLELIFANPIAQDNVLNSCNAFQLKAFYSKLKQSFEILSNSDKASSHFYFSTSTNSFRFDIVYAEPEQRIYLYGVNITREMSLAEEIKSQADYLNRILDNVPVDIALFNTKHQYQYINKIAVKDDDARNWLIGRTDFEYCDYRGKDTTVAEARRKYFNSALNKKDDIDYVDKIKVEKGLKYVLRRFHPVVKDNKVTEVIGYAVDITEQIQAQKKLFKTYDMLFNNQIVLKQILSYYVHNVKHPMSNIEGLIENFNKEDLADPENKFVIEGLVKSYEELNQNFKGFTDRLDQSFNSFQTEKQQIDIKSSIINHADYAMERFPLKYRLRFPSTSVVGFHFYTFMFNRIFKQLFRYFAHTIDKSYINITVVYTETDHYNTISLTIPKIHLSNSKVLTIKEAVKSIDRVDFDVNKNYIADIACILACSSGYLSFDYTADKLRFDLHFPKLNFNA